MYRARNTIPLLLAAACLAGLAGCSGSEETTAGTTSLRARIVQDAKSWRGTPYRYGGRSKEGTDCSGLVYTVFARHGLSLPRRAADQYKAGKPVRSDVLAPGDLVFFRNTAGPGITHVGIYVGNGSFIHSSTRKGVIISRLSETYYRKHFAGARRVLP